MSDGLVCQRKKRFVLRTSLKKRESAHATTNNAHILLSLSLSLSLSAREKGERLLFDSQMLPSSSSSSKTKTTTTTTTEEDDDDVEEKTKKKQTNAEKNQNLGAFALFLRATEVLFSQSLKEFGGGAFVLLLPKKAKEARGKILEFLKDTNTNTNNELMKQFWTQTREEEKSSDFLHFEKKTKILREVTDACKEILSNQEVYSQGGRQKVAVKALECLFLVMNFVEKEKVRVSGTNSATENVEMMMTCSATMLRDVCKAVAFCGKDDSSLEITRMVVKMLLALATSEHIVNSGIFQGEEGEEALEILTLRLAHSAVASDGDVERRVAKTALVQHINNCFKRCSEGEFRSASAAGNINTNGDSFFSDQSALTCLKALCKIASRDSDGTSATTSTMIAEENADANNANKKPTTYFSAANALDADEYILASRFLAIDLLRQLCEGPNARAWLAAYRNELKKPLSEALLMNAMLNPKSTLQKGGVAGVAAAAAATASGAINNNSNNNAKRLSFEGIEKTLNASTNRTTITTSTSNNSNTILHGFSNATRFHPMALASSSLARGTYAAIVSRARDSWKSEIALMFPTMLLHPLERSKSTHVKAKIAALKTLRQIYDDPSTAADVFVNYDCDPRCSTNCFERSAKAILETLKVEREKERILVKISSGSSIDIDSVAVRDAATQCLVAIVRSLRVWRARNKELGEDLFHDEDSIDEVERKASSTLRRSGSVSTSFELIPSQNVVVSSSTAAAKQDNKNQAESNNSTTTTRTTRTTPGSESEGVIGGGLLSSVPLENVPTTSSSSSIAKPSQTKTFANLKKEKKSVEIAVKKFNKTPTMAVLREHAPSNSVVSASDAAKFLRSAPGVDPSAIGHLLGSSDADGVAVIRAYLENFDFTNEYVDEALRKFMSTFRIPGEAQQIDRLTECFAKRFIELNPNFGGQKIEKKVDCVTIIAFAIIMLNTDAHNPMVDVKMRMSREDFLNMALDTPETRGLDEEMIRGVYDRVTKEEIILSADKRAIAETASSSTAADSSSTTTAAANSGLMSDFGIFGAFKKKQKILEMEEKIASEEAKALLRETARAFSAVTTRSTIAPVGALSPPQLKNGQGSNSELDESAKNNNDNVFVGESAFHAAAEAGLARPMFEVIGEALCRALSIAFGLANDPGRAAMALECARSAMRLAFETKLYTLRDLFGQFLCNATGVSASDNDRRNSNADDNDNDDDATRVDLRAMQRAEATKTLLDCAKSDGDFIKLGQIFWKSCIDICVSLEIAMLENDSTALRGVANVNNSSNGTAQESTDGVLPDKTKVEKNIQRLLGFKNVMAWLRPFSREAGLETEINPDAKAAIDACFVNSSTMDASELSHVVDALIQRSERDLCAAEQSEITKSPNTRIAMKRLADVARANLNGRSLAAWRNVIWGPASLHLAMTATSCVQIETLVNRNACKEASECLRVVAEAVLLKRGSAESAESKDKDGNITPTKRKTTLTNLETDEDINSSNADAAREDALLPFYEAIRTVANSSFRNSGLGNETVFFEMKTRKAEFIVDALRRLAETSSKKFGNSWRRVAQTLEVVASNATLSEYHGNTEEYDGNPEDQVKVLFADSAKIRAFVSFRNVIVESVLKGRSMKEEVSTTTPSIADGELTDDVLPDIVDVLAKFRDVEKQTKNDKGDFIVVSEALLSLQEIILRADRSTARGRNLWKVTTRCLISATFSIENTRATTVRAFESVFASALNFTAASQNKNEEKAFWQDVCEDAIDPIVSFTREEYYGNHAHKSAPKNEGFSEAKVFSLATFFPRLVSNVTSSKNVGYDIVSIGCANAFANADVASTSLIHALSCVAAFGTESTSSSSQMFWSFACDFLENAIGARKKKSERDEVISKSLVCDFIPELYSSCAVTASKNRIANVARTIHIDAFTSAMDKRGEEEHEELLYNSTRAVLATTTNDASGTLTACEIVLRYHISNKGKEISSFDVSTRTIAMLASVVDALTNMIKRKKKKNNDDDDGDGRSHSKTEEEESKCSISSLAKQKKEVLELFTPQLSSLVALGRYPLNKSLRDFFSATFDVSKF